MNITILSVTVTTVPTAKGSYQVADVAFKNNTFGKVEGKKVMSFGVTADTFKALAVAQAGESYDVTVVKNDKGYNDWTKLTKGGADAAQAPVPQTYAANTLGAKTAATTAPRSTFETPEERAVKQVYIVKQSSLSAAVSTLSVGAKTLKPDDVIALAQKYTDFVFGKKDLAAAGGATGFDDVPNFDEEFTKPSVI